MLGYQGESFRSSSQRQSGAKGISVHTGYTEGAGQVRHRGVGGDYQIKLRDGCSSLCVVGQFRREVADLTSECRVRRAVPRPDPPAG